MGISQHLVEALLWTLRQQDAVVLVTPLVVALIQHLEPGQQCADHFIVMSGRFDAEVLHHSVAEDRADLRASVLCGADGSRRGDDGVAGSRRLDHAPVVLGLLIYKGRLPIISRSEGKRKKRVRSLRA